MTLAVEGLVCEEVQNLCEQCPLVTEWPLSLASGAVSWKYTVSSFQQ